ncbi:MAG TPA: carbohydrate binding domain-containing protein [Sedimentisphaerales bacterium]|nr:carbohydrate binding domain-containing protein [Sedimentisphaerales bacterium]HRS10145.1 carbohydrate binding domain-containing protein [Sedimentisphaerales bacterium]HRV46851.1 carbohydrate binding domain-containing protein [Sedimentisphaerales bacterium]
MNPLRSTETDQAAQKRTRLCLGAIFRVAAGLGLLLSDRLRGQEFVPFVIPAEINRNHAIWVNDYKPIAIDSKRIEAHGGHFYQGGRLRIWGVNLCFGANFPTHEDAPKVAARLAAAGVNSVRLHHMDTARWPRGLWNTQDGRTIEPQALDRLDYFIHELAGQGIYVNINLHVGRAHSEYLGLPKANREYDKIVGIFTPALIDAQKQFARELLTHVNPYRGVRYADDPAVAFVEITNEDSLFMWGAEETLRTLPAHYADILRGRFNAWLRQQYPSDEALAAAWGKDIEPLRQDMVANGRFIVWEPAGNMPKQWNLEQHEGCQAKLSRSRSPSGDAVQIDIDKASQTQWHLQLTQGGLKVTKGRYYTLSFEAAAQAERQIGCVVSQAHSPWANLGLSRDVNLTTGWRTFEHGFVATADDDNARIGFSFSGDTTPFHLAHVELRPGGQVGLTESESPRTNTVALFKDRESTARILDRMIFLAKTEKTYFDDMRAFIKNDLGCAALVTGTIVFGPLGLYAQSDMDFIDSHAYWQHPRFPGRPWDQGNWLIDQKPMTDYPNEATLFRIAAERLAGKPFTVSEYNHPAPLDAQAECVPMIASFAAAQDWDGIWLFTYSHATGDWARQTMSNFFDMDTNPAKWGFMRAGAALFRDSGLGPLAGLSFSSLTMNTDVAGGLAALHLKHNGDMLDAAGVVRENLLKAQHVRALAGQRGHRDLSMGSDIRIKWTVEEKQGLYVVQGRRAAVYTGHATRFREGTDGKITITQPQFVTLTMTSLDARERQTHERILVTACGRCENVGMQFSADRRTVGRNWGQAPVQIEAVRGSLVLPEGQWTCQALAPDGSPKQHVPVVQEGNESILNLAPTYGTMWYLLERPTQ